MRSHKIFGYSKTTTGALLLIIGSLGLVVAGTYTSHNAESRVKDSGGGFKSIYSKLPTNLFLSNVLNSPTIATDKTDYPIGATVVITGTGWQAGEVVTLQVTDDLSPTDPNHEAHAPWTVIADANGNVSTTWTVDQDADGLVLTLTATGTISGTVSTTFTDANPSANLDQCANDQFPSPSSDGCDTDASQWVNGNLGASKSVYFEGDSIPYRMVFDNLSTGAGNPHKVTIEWDTTKSDKHAIDYLTSFNRSVLDANPCLGVSGCNPVSFDTEPIPKDPQVDNGSGSPITQAPGVFTLYGGTITAVSAPDSVGSTDCSTLTLGKYCYSTGFGFSGDNSAAITITFTASVDNPVLAWGGHIAQRRAGNGSGGWGDNNAAVNIPGSPYHTRLIDLDGSGGNQDRSLSADAVIFPGSITIIKQANPEGSDQFSFTASPSPLSNFSLVDDGTAANTKVFSNIIDFQTYTVAETVPSGWTLTGLSCSVTSPNGGSQSVNSPSVSINLKEGENVTCTYTNSGDSVTKGKIKVVKVTVPAGSSQLFPFTPSYETGFSLTGQNGSNSDTSAFLTPSAVSGAPVYSVSEGSVTNWTSDDGVCDRGTPSNIIVIAGQITTCTFTNTRDQGYFKIKKVFDPLTSGFVGTFTIHYDCGGGDQTVSLAAGATSAAIGPFDTGTQCTVTEPTTPTAPTGWTFGTPSVSGSPVTIVKNTAATTNTLATVTNTITRDQGYFKIKKVFDPLTSGFAGTFTIHYDCGGANNGDVILSAGNTSAAIGPFNTGTQCTVTEPNVPAAPTGWTFGTPSISGSPVTIVKDTAATTTSLAMVTNTISRDQGYFKIKKVFDPLTSGFAGTFTIHYDCGAGDQTVSLAAGATSAAIGPFNTGTQCTVTEPSTPAAPAGWTFGTPSVSGSPVTIVKDTAATTTSLATVTNTITRDQGYFKIKKAFDAKTSGFVGSFTIHYDCGGGNANDVLLTAGSTSSAIGPFDTGTQCTVTEPNLPTAPAGWTFGTPSVDISPVTIVKDTAATTTTLSTVTNTITRDQGFFKIKKVFDPLTSGFSGSFTIHYDCGGGNASDVLLTAGSTSSAIGPFDTGTQCTITEPNLPTSPAGWTFGTPSVDISPVTIVKNTAATTTTLSTVTNSITRDRGYLTLVKNVVNDNGGTATVTDFLLNSTVGSLSFTPSGSGTTMTYTSQKFHVPTGPYTLKEGTFYGYTNGTWTCVGASTGALTNNTYNNGSITVGKDQDITCQITNDDNPATIVIVKNAKPQSGTFSFDTTGTTSGPGTNWPTNFTLNGSTSGGGNTKSYTVDRGSYSVHEGMQLSWLLTGIGGGTPAGDGDTFSCVTTGSGGSTGTGKLSTAKVDISIFNGDTVTCTFENTGSGATRTQGFWATHSQLANIAWFGGSAFTHTFPGVGGVSGIGDTTLCGRPIDTLGKLMGGFWSDISKTTTNKKRSPLDQARMQLLQQLLAAELNASAFGTSPGTGSFTAWESAYCGTNQSAISTAQQQAASFNSQGDSSTFTPGTSADSKVGRAIANYAFWDVLP